MEQTNPELTPKQSLDILAQAATQFRGTRAEHELIDKALRALLPLVEPKPAA